MQELLQQENGVLAPPGLPGTHPAGNRILSLRHLKTVSSTGAQGQLTSFKVEMKKEPMKISAIFAALALVFATAVKKKDVWRIALKEWNMRESEVVKEWQDEARREQQLKTRTEAVLEVLVERFGNLPPEVPDHLKSIEDANVLRQLLQKAVRAANLDDFRKQIPNGTQNGTGGEKQ